MKAIFAFLFLTFISFKGFSQFETPKRTVNIAPISNPKGTISPTSSKAITYPSIFDKKDKLLSTVSLLKKKEEEEKSVFEKEKFSSPAEEKTQQLNDQLKAEGYTSVVDNSDVFLGEFVVTTYKLNIGCRDYGAIDGDNVTIWLNGEKVIPGIYLESGLKMYHFQLKDGLNTLQIEALNTGALFPNTGQFVFYDGNDKLVTNQQWALNTGYKAIVKIRKIDGLEVEEQVDMKNLGKKDDKKSGQ